MTFREIRSAHRRRIDPAATPKIRMAEKGGLTG